LKKAFVNGGNVEVDRLRSKGCGQKVAVKRLRSSKGCGGKLQFERVSHTQNGLVNEICIERRPPTRLITQLACGYAQISVPESLGSSEAFFTFGLS
jgi:hypothetical protein